MFNSVRISQAKVPAEKQPQKQSVPTEQPESTPAEQKQTSTTPKAAVNNAGDIFKALDMKTEQRLYDRSAKDVKTLETRKKNLEMIERLLTSAEGGSVAFKVSAEPCAELSVDEKTVSQEEVIAFYQEFKKRGQAILALMNQIMSQYAFLKDVALPAARQKNVGANKVQPGEIDDSQHNYQNLIMSLQDEMAELAFKITQLERKGNIYIALAPLKQEYFDASSNLCLVEKEANITKKILGFYSRDEMEKLVSGYQVLTSILQKYLKVYPALAAAESMSKESLKTNYQNIQKIIKYYKEKEYEIYQSVFEQIKPKSKGS